MSYVVEPATVISLNALQKAGEKKEYTKGNELGLDDFTVTCVETGLLESGSIILLYTYLSTAHILQKNLLKN